MKEKLSGTSNYDRILSENHTTISSAEYRNLAERKVQQISALCNW
jgi:hypothetical protein